MIDYKEGEAPNTVTTTDQHDKGNENPPEHDEEVEAILSSLQSNDRVLVSEALECIIYRSSRKDTDERWFEPNVIESMIIAFSEEMSPRYANFIMKFCRKTFTEDRDLEPLLVIEQPQFFSIMFTLFQYRGTVTRNHVFKMLLTLMENDSVSGFLISQVFERDFLSVIFESSKFEMNVLEQSIHKIDSRSGGDSLKSNSQYFELLFRFMTNLIYHNDGSFDTEYMKRLLAFSYYLFDKKLSNGGIFHYLNKDNKINLIISIVQLYDILIQDDEIRSEIKEIIGSNVVRLILASEYGDLEIIPPMMILFKHFFENEGISALTPYLICGAASCLVDETKACQELYDFFYYVVTCEEARPILYQESIFEYLFSGLELSSFTAKENCLNILCEAIPTAEQPIVENYVNQKLFQYMADLISNNTKITHKIIDTIGRIVSKFPHLTEKVTENVSLMEALHEIADSDGDSAELAEQLISFVSPIDNL